MFTNVDRSKYKIQEDDSVHNNSYLQDPCVHTIIDSNIAGCLFSIKISVTPRRF